MNYAIYCIVYTDKNMQHIGLSLNIQYAIWNGVYYLGKSPFYLLLSQPEEDSTEMVKYGNSKYDTAPLAVKLTLSH